MPQQVCEMAKVSKGDINQMKRSVPVEDAALAVSQHRHCARLVVVVVASPPEVQVGGTCVASASFIRNHL